MEVGPKLLSHACGHSTGQMSCFRTGTGSSNGKYGSRLQDELPGGSANLQKACQLLRTETDCSNGKYGSKLQSELPVVSADLQRACQLLQD